MTSAASTRSIRKIRASPRRQYAATYQVAPNISGRYGSMILSSAFAQSSRRWPIRAALFRLIACRITLSCGGAGDEGAAPTAYGLSPSGQFGRARVVLRRYVFSGASRAAVHLGSRFLEADRTGESGVNQVRDNASDDGRAVRAARGAAAEIQAKQAPGQPLLTDMKKK
jgi:hypothetical protein